MIEASGLTKIFGDSERGDTTKRFWRRKNAGRKVVAVDDVTFSVERGELFVIMGLSGSGKSTLLRMLNRLVTPTAGRLTVDGNDVLGLRDSALRDLRNRTVSMVFQHFALFPHRTVAENVEYGLHVRHVDSATRKERATWALDAVGLGEWGDALPSELSGGMRQRVGLARALATDAEVLLMDEPFSALDPLIRREMQDLLLRLQADLRRTIVFVTHDLNEAMRIGERIMVMRAGRVIQLGTGPDIVANPADDYVSDFVADVDRSRVLTAETVMCAPLLTARIDDSPADSLRRLSNVEGVGMYVLDDAGRVAGVARDDLLAQAAREGAESLADCVVDEYEHVDTDTPLSDLFELVGQGPVPLAVTAEGGELLGVVPRAALLSAMSTPKKVSHA